ncbi:MAG: CHRD domain-containing protein [Nevskiaceae bacterium]
MSNPAHRLVTVYAATIMSSAAAVLMLGVLVLHPVRASAQIVAPAPANLHLGPVRFYADLSAGEQTATVASAGQGRAEFSLDRQTLSFSWRVNVDKLTSRALGISVNGPQRPGTNAGVQIDLAPRGAASRLQGSAVLTEAQLDYLLAGRMYVNVRTTRYPAGELRGQIQRVPLTAEQIAALPEPPPLRAAAVETSPAGVRPTVVATARKARTLGYVIANWDNAIYESRFMDECPEGPAIGNDELWWRGLSRADKDKLTDKGLVQPVDRRFVSVFRGPTGEDVCWNPTLVKDPPLRTVKAKAAYGFDLDGRSDGRATPKSCAHSNFVGVRGERGVDNQMYRLLGCHYGWRRNGVLDTFGNEERRNSGRGVILLEIKGVTDERNSPNVEVGFYRATDPYQIDSAGRILPWASYRVDMQAGKPRYGAVARGRIENGVLKTEPLSLKLPFYGNAAYAELDLKDMRLELDLKPAKDGKVHGLVGGYYDFDKWWEYMLKLEFLIATGDWSCPALYQAARELADGYPDPRTGECTAISSAFRMDALPAFVVHDSADAPVRASR